MESPLKNSLRKAKKNFDFETQKAKETGKTGTIEYLLADDKLTRMIELARAEGHSAKEIRAAQDED